MPTYPLPHLAHLPHTPHPNLQTVADSFEKFYRQVFGTISLTTMLAFLPNPSLAQVGDECQLSAQEREQKRALMQAAVAGDATAQQTYRSLLTQQAERLSQCRRQSWLQTQATWLRLYPCDTKPGMLDALFDEIVNRGYNQVNLDVFSNGQVLLPAADNPTAWMPLLQEPGTDRIDLLAEAIQKGHERGLKVYAWLFSLNFGQTYADRPDLQQVLARNGEGETTVSAAIKASFVPGRDITSVNEIFVDPYSPQAIADFSQLVQAVLQRRPDGVLFDYIRYPKGLGGASVASKVKDLWIYGDASLQALEQRGLNQKGQELIRRYVKQGYLSAQDLAAVDQLYPAEKEPQWQGRSPSISWAVPTAERLPAIQKELWNLAVAHAMQGPVDFLAAAIAPVQQQGIPAGAVFFPEANRMVGKGYDSRLQAWNRFPNSIEWHPMAYGVCGDTSCIVEQVQTVLSQAPAGTRVEPVLTGMWGQATAERPALEAQMQALRSLSPTIQSLSHFSFGWQDPQWERERKFCRL
ncbi:family 10 glycosylhydrolase [Kovacikia minuta CCNUW1]|uniref:family 10 glycosylhydrolase n=1 Tax=Kovacikia minuta TaxID=2931930 RepID=UPI001CC900EA|nr:family 10 glycosylhydrolase [Kovacikia minuta]UBF29153.1 family 10 glycosylhydrolase [Kovacikia minuta CCNUW1]